MKNFFLKHKSILGILLSSLLFITLYYVAFRIGYVRKIFDLDTREALIDPLFALMLCIVPILCFFLFFPEKLFKLWLRRIAWWYFLVIFFMTANTPIYSSHVLSMERSQIVLFWMILLAVITVLFVLVMRKRLPE